MRRQWDEKETPIPSFFLDDLLGRIPERWRGLLSEVRDKGGIAPAIPVTGGRSFELARRGDLVFCKDEAPQRLKALAGTPSVFAVVRPAALPLLPGSFADDRVLIIAERPRMVIALLLLPFGEEEAVARQRVKVSRRARVGEGVRLGPGVVIGPDVTLGPGVVIGPNTVVDHARIGAGTRIGANCTIGLDSFGYEVDEGTGEAVRLVHFGLVHIGRHVEVLSNACLCRGSFHDTVIEDHVKIGNLVNVGHNVTIGRGSLVTGSDVLGGSSSVGECVWIAPSTTVMNGISLGAYAMTGLGAIVVRSVEENDVVAGLPARVLHKRFPRRPGKARG